MCIRDRLKLNQSKHDPRNWRPHILVFVADLERNLGMVRMANHFSQERGIVTVSTLLKGDIEDNAQAETIAEKNRLLLDANGIVAFAETAAVPDVDAGMITVAQANGMAGLVSNMVMFGWPGNDEERLARLLGLVRRLDALEKSTMIVRPVKGSRSSGNGEIVVWWKGKENNGDMMLLLSHLLNLAAGWRSNKVVLKSVVDDHAQSEEVQDAFASMLPDLRMDVRLDVIVKPQEKTQREIIREESQGADLVFFGMAVPIAGAEHAYAGSLITLLDALPTTILVRNASRFHGRLV